MCFRVTVEGLMQLPDRKLTGLNTRIKTINTSAMGKIDEIKLSIESEDFAQRRTGRKGTSYYNGLAAGYREGYRKRANEAGTGTDKCHIQNVVCSSRSGKLDIGITAGKEYKTLAAHKDMVCIINDFGDLSNYNIAHFKD